MIENYVIYNTLNGECDDDDDDDDGDVDRGDGVCSGDGHGSGVYHRVDYGGIIDCNHASWGL